jgi:putative hydrolase of the HAD superfamily
MRFGCVLDLDDTLYLERDYVRSGFRAVADLVGGGSVTDADRVFNLLWEDYLGGSRGSSFDLLLQRFPDLTNERTVGDLVAAYREHPPQIEFVPGMLDVIEDLGRRGISLAVISDGAHASQAAKCHALRILELADPVVLTDAWGREFWKPHPRAFQHVGERLGLQPGRLVYIGDNPAKDFTSPIALGWSAIRLRLPGQLHQAAPVTEPDVLEARTPEEMRALVIGLAESNADREDQ